MSKNIIIAVLVFVCFGFIIYSFYQKALVEKSLNEAVEQRELTIEAMEEVERQRAIAEKTMEEALYQSSRAEQALLVAERQREIALSKCK